MAAEKSNEKIKLILPSAEMRNRVMEYRDAFLKIGESIHGDAGLYLYDSFDEWLNSLRPENLREGFLPSTTFIAVRLSDNAVVGITDIRHYLTEAQYHNGHIGYSVHPRERGKGYGTEILRLALIKADQLGIIETVVACYADNRTSKRVIERNGLRFQKKVTADGKAVLIYTTSRD